MKYVRLLRDGSPVWGVLERESVRTLAKAPYEELAFDGKSLELKDCKLLAPCEPTKLVCIGRNYYDHIAELRSMVDGSGTPEQPTLFLKGLNCLNHPEGHVSAPEFVTRLDYEGELGVVIKKRAKNVKEKDFADYDHRVHHGLHDPGAGRYHCHRHSRRGGADETRRCGGGGGQGRGRPPYIHRLRGGGSVTGLSDFLQGMDWWGLLGLLISAAAALFCITIHELSRRRTRGG